MVIASVADLELLVPEPDLAFHNVSGPDLLKYLKHFGNFYIY